MTTSTDLMSSRKIVAAGLTVVFGSIPATFIAVAPAMALAMSLAGLFSTRTNAEFGPILFFLLWGFAGIYGTLALWLTPFLGRSAFVKTGLVFGLLAIAPVSVAILVNIDSANLLGLKLDWESVSGIGFITVPLVAISWLYYFAKTKSRITFFNP